ncbi:MAG TPA: GerAB/ArcD/ProY family transporter [Mobilitalea sp.]|nr:GerAB/ArcD/ProY family transporter [Mobilitalea sp.]
MNKELSLRQIVYLYLFLSVSPILRQIPAALAGEAGRSGYLSPLWSILVLLPLTGIILLLIESFPGLNIYEIMVQLIGKILAKLIILTYMLWFLLLLTTKVSAYSMTIQFTLMPKTRSDFFMITLIVMVFYALLRGIKTIFRFSEFTLGPVIVFFIILIVCSLGRIRTDYLLPVSKVKLPSTIMASKNVISVGGFIIIALFFSDKLGITVSKLQKRKLWYGVLVFALLTFGITVFTFGITGANLTANLPFPFYISVKSISFFNIFERFEVLVTLICVLSDFIAICTLATLLTRSIQWLFDIKERGFLFVPLSIIVYYLTYLTTSTQFEFDFLYRYVIINLNLIYQFLIPFFLGVVCLIRRKNIKKLN